MLCTKRGYKRSVIFSLFANSNARSKGILQIVSSIIRVQVDESRIVPHALQMHRADLHYMSDLLALEDTIPTATRHPRNVEQLGPIDHMVIYGTLISKSTSNPTRSMITLTFSSSDANTLRLNLVAETTLIFPQCGRDSWFGPGRSYLSCRVIDVPLQWCTSCVCITLGCHRVMCHYLESQYYDCTNKYKVSYNKTFEN